MSSVAFDLKGTRYEFVFPVEGDHIARMIRRHGRFYESDLLERIRALDISGTYIDVGAHVGNHTVYFAQCCPSDEVIAFEPSQRNLKCLLRNIDVNIKNGKRVSVVPFAAGEDCKKYEVRVQDEHNSGMDTLAWKEGEGTSASVDTVVEGVSRPPVGFVKIDTEGSELQVLSGMTRTLARFKPVLAIEAITKRDLELQRGLLQPIGYAYEGPYASTPVYIWRVR